MKIVAKNKKAYHNYEILDTLEAGIALFGDEVKSLRAGKISIDESFAVLQKGEVSLINCYISPYEHAYSKDDTTRRSRKLLLNRREINKLAGDISRKGLTLVPLKVYFTKRGLAKVELGIAKHKKAHSKKKELRERDIKREAQRELKVRVK